MRCKRPWEANCRDGALKVRGPATAKKYRQREVCRVYGANHATVELVVNAPAMALALEMVACGVARLERTGTLTEFCFDGLRYSVHGQWSALMDMIGWDFAHAAIEKAKGT
jgi:hypothetical protein